ncbi:hypothetical protein P885DRAFT_78126 [Corynascus similis CBS 632.67]
MLRTAILRSTAITARTAVRPIPSAAARRIAVAPAPRVSSFVPKMVAWKPVRCYASGGSLERDEIYERVVQVFSNVPLNLSDTVLFASYVQDNASQALLQVEDPSEVTETTSFIDDLGLDSIDLVELRMDIEQEFSIEIPDGDGEYLKNISDVVDFIYTKGY